MSSQSSFGDQAAAWAGKLKRHINVSVREAVTETLSAVIADTPVQVDDSFFPVDDHMTRENWMPSIGAPSDSSHDRAEGAAEQDLQYTTEEWVPVQGNSLFLTNNDDYAVMLEYGLYRFKNRYNTTEAGFSTQAPEGMVRVNLLRFPGIMRRRWNGST